MSVQRKCIVIVGFVEIALNGSLYTRGILSDKQLDNRSFVLHRWNEGVGSDLESGWQTNKIGRS